MATKKLTPAEKAAKDLKLNKNQTKALLEYEKLYGNIETLISNRSVYQIGNNLRSKALIRLFFTEV